MDSRHGRKRIVILGGGFGGSYLAKELSKRRHGLDVDVVIIDRNNYFIFYPLLIEAGCGSIEPRHCTVPIREFAPKAELLMAEVSGLDIEQQRVHFQLVGDDHCRSIEYDHLVVALGSVTRVMPENVVSGVREHAFFVKHMSDAVTIRDRAVELLELANAIDDPEERRRLLHFVIVGGNVTGIEVVGELEVFVREASAHYRNVSDDDIMFSVYEFNKRLLAVLPENLSSWATRHLANRGIDIHTGAGIKEVHADHVVDSDGNVVPCCLTYDDSISLGKINNKSLKEILHENRFLKNLRSKTGEKHLTCRKCFGEPTRRGVFARNILNKLPSSFLKSNLMEFIKGS